MSQNSRNQKEANTTMPHKNNREQQQGKKTVTANDLTRGVQQHYTTLQAAHQPLRARIGDLERDWTTRTEEFWLELLDILHTLRSAAQSCLRWNATEGLSWEYALKTWGKLESVDEAIDEAGISLTAYAAVCLSMKPQHLRQRHHVLSVLRELAGKVEEVLDLLGGEVKREKEEATV